MHNPGHIADTIVNLGKSRDRLAEISELNPAERYRQIRGPDQIDTGHLVVMSQQFGDTGVDGANVGYPVYEVEYLYSAAGK